MKMGSIVRAFGEIGVILEVDQEPVEDVLVQWSGSRTWVWYGVLEVICE